MSKIVRLSVLFAVVSTAADAAAAVSGDARRGAQLFRDQKCVTCHSVFGEGGKAAPDLGARFSRGYTAPQMAALMWNHAPEMWSAMSAKGIARPELSNQDAADLFAFFAGARYFERLGEPSRGAELFRTKKCASCHEGGGPGKPIKEWTSLGDPITLAARMWDHVAQMRSAMGGKKIPWVSLTPQELSDIAHYVRAQPGMPRGQAEFAFGDPGQGADLFKSKGCAGCHVGKMDLSERLSVTSLTDVAAAMWNHAPKMQRDTPNLTDDEMRAVVSYVWAGSFFKGSGNAAAGKRLFAKKQCASCHAGANAPKLEAGASAITLVSALTKHGPTMLDSMKAKGVAWPRFQNTEMADVIAFLNRE
jgi:mono/diheme cytochrome c family protein